MKLHLFLLAIVFPLYIMCQVPESGFLSNWRTIAGEPIKFTDTSSNSPIWWEWHFDGGSPEISFDQNPVVVYNAHGTYTVTLISGNAFGSDTLIAFEYLHSYEKIYGDTLNYPTPGGDTLLVDSFGYVCGNNERHLQAIANRFVINNLSVFYSIVEGVAYRFAIASNKSIKIAFCIWAADGPGGAPGTVLATDSIPMADIHNNINDSIFTDALFYYWTNYWNDSTVFYAGFLLPTDDSLAIFSSQDSAVIPGSAWAADSLGNWKPLSDVSMGGVNISMAIFPVMGAYINSVYENPKISQMSVSPNPVSNEIFIHFEGNPKYVVRIYNSIGKIVLEQNNMTYSNNKIDCSALESGLYVIEVVGNQRSQALFIKL